MKDYPTFFPQQKIPTNQKTKDWYKKCLDSAESLALYKAAGMSDLHHKMQVWEDLYNDIIDENEIERVFNPMQISEAAFPASIKNYPLSVPKIDLLRGEEIKRKFDWTVTSQNQNTKSEMDSQIRDELISFMLAGITEGNYDPREVEAKVKDISKFYKYSYKDLNEISATRVLQYLWRQQVLKSKFSEGFHEAMVKGREIYRIDDIGGEPSVVPVDSKFVFPIRMGTSHRIEDSDIIVEVGYSPIGAIIDEFYDYLKPADIKQLETGQGGNMESHSGVLGYNNEPPRLYASTQLGGDDDTLGELVTVNSDYNLPYDRDGNVRIVRVRWRGRRKIGRLTYFDPMTGEEQTRLVSENYQVKDLEGETVKWLWINEAYEATRIADDIYVKMQPRDVQIRFFDNPSKCFLGYVGTDYGKSLMSRMEPYQYLYNVYMRRLELAIAKYKGPIYELDITKKPDEWELDQWMYYAEILGWAVVDPFNEGKKGAAQGQLAGQWNTTGKVLNADVGNYIQQLIMMLQYIEKQMGQIAGVTEQRQGQIDNRETVGGIERSVTQSSHITEKWFFIHDETKKRVLEALLDVAKATWKKGSKKLNFVMEDMSRVMVELSEDFSSTEYDIFVSNSSEDMEIRQVIKELSHAAVQNGASITLPITILRSDSITEMARRIEEEEELQVQREQEAARMSNETAEKIQKATLEDKQKDRDLKYYEIDSKNETQLRIASMRDSDEPEDDDQEKLQLEKKKHEDTINLKRDDLKEKVRHNKETEQISRKKSN